MTRGVGGLGKNKFFMTWGEGGVSQKVILHDKGGGGVQTPLKNMTSFMNNPLSVCPVLDVKWAVLVLNISHLLSALFLITFEGPPPSRSHHAINNLELLDKVKFKKLICKYVLGLLFSQVD